MKNHRKISIVVSSLAVLAVSTPAWADGAGAFVGGMMANRVMTNMSERTQAEQEQAYNSRQQAQPVPQAAPAATSPQQKLDQLDKLAAGGYITKQEYQQRRKAILDAM